MEPMNSPLPDALAGKLQRIEDLAEKLVYVKWSQEFFVLLQKAAQDVLTLARPRLEYRKVVVLAERLERQISQSLEKGELPGGADREQLIAVVDALCRAASRPGDLDSDLNKISDPGALRQAEGLTLPLFSKWGFGEASQPGISEKSPITPSIWLVAPAAVHELGRKLQQRGCFKIEFYDSLSEIDALLAQSEQPIALVVDLDHLAGKTDRQTSLRELAALRQRLAPEIPMFFLADRGDITARLEAVQAGGAGYFVKPVNMSTLLETLDEQALKALNHRVLIIEDTLHAAREIARLLSSRGMATHVLAQPLQILQMLRNVQPSLLIMSLDLKETDGLMLAQALQQHESFRGLPLILLSARADIGQRLSVVGLSNATFLSRPLEPELLVATATHRLRQGHGLHRKFSQLSNRDTVSGLYNRPYFLVQLERALVATAASTQSVAVMLIALDDLRHIESQDVSAADDVIEQAAMRLQAALGPDPIIARFGDAVFTVLLGFANQQSLMATARAAQASLESDPYLIAGKRFLLHTSTGISVASSATRDAATLIQQADLACGMARDSKDTRIHVQHGKSTEPDADNTRQRLMLDEIREAVQQQRMNLLFQPIVSLRGDTTERYEVLLRMRNREGWELLPETVFSMVKRHRIGMVLDRWVIAHSIRILRERQARGQSVILFINISPTILQDEELLNWLQNGLQKTGVAAASLVFEMVESTASLHQQALLPFLRQLKGLGCGISLDHFSGQERAQALVQAMQADYVKLDSRFVQSVLDDKVHQQQLSYLARGLSTLGVTTIVTGIEDAMVLPVLWSCGIDYVQGFFLQRPHTDMNYNFEQLVL